MGVSFSIKNCAEYGVGWEDALAYTLSLGFKRLRLMSYWDLHEKERGQIDFADLKKQIQIIKSHGGRVTLCLGMRQPRWPETHLSAWAKEIDPKEAAQAYLNYQAAVIKEFKDEECIESWQLENEFWLRSFGKSFDFSRTRLKAEFNQLRQADPSRPIIMSIASTMSIPLRGPKPDIYATSMYRNLYDKGRYRKTYFSPWFYRTRRIAIRFLRWRDLIIHELQTEPWGPQANWEMSDQEQFKSMNADEIKGALDYARKTGIKYMDLWGAEWWYWRKIKRDDDSLEPVLKSLNN